MRDASYRAWEQGQYANIAFSVVMENAFAKKGSKREEYPVWKDPIEKIEKKKIAPIKDIENEFRIQQAEQNAWLMNIGK